MKNREKYKTRELLEEFYKFLEKRCGSGTCKGCEVRDLCDDLGYDGIFVGWLELEAEEEKPEPCPFCGGKTHTNSGHVLVDVVHY